MFLMTTVPQITGYYYPTTTILLDDSERFITHLSLELDSDLAYVSFSNPRKALQYIDQHSKPQALTERCLLPHQESESYGLKPTQHEIKVDLSELFQEIYNPGRFNEPSIVVVDYSMPMMTGREFCTRLKNLPIKKILLTGQADTDLGINLFNEGLIDKFIRKDSENFGSMVNASIIELQKRYFEEQSQTVIENLITQPNSCLNDPAFVKLFYEICEKHHIVEYYLIQSSGSFLLLTFEGQALWLIVTTSSELKEICHMAEDYSASPAILKLLQNGQRIPYFPSNNEYLDAQGIKWEPYLHSAEKLQGLETYYYALVSTPPLFPIDENKILSYKKYLRDIWPPI